MNQFFRNMTILACLAIATVTIFAVEPSNSAETERYRLRVAANEDGRNTLSAMGMDIAGHDLSTDRVEVIATADEFRRILEAGFHVGNTPPFGRERPGTIAALSPRHVASPIDERELHTIRTTTKGIPYRDPTGISTNRDILRRREETVKQFKARGVV